MQRIASPIDKRQSDHAATIQRGVSRLMRSRGFATVAELPLATGRRADLVCLGPSGDIWIIEIKSSVEDYRADRKWPDYRLSCDRLFFATHCGVPPDIFPVEAGLILADAYGGEVLRDAPEHRLAAATRKAMLVRFGQAAAHRLQGIVDPGTGGFGQLDN